MSVRLHHRPADAQPRLSIKESAFNDIGADEVDARTEQPRQQAGLLATLEVRLRTQLGKMELLLAEVLRRAP